MAYRILVADDEADIVRLLQDLFTRQGYQVLAACGGKEALELCSQKPDLILLDVNMPDMDGFTLCRQIRDFVSCPILFLTARIEDADKVMGFAAGGDDYILKPFSNQELLARVDVVLRRYNKTEAVLEIGGLRIDTVAMQVTRGGAPVPLTRKEYEILLLFARNPGVALYRETIYERVWEEEFPYGSRTVDLHIQRLRKKVGWEDRLLAVNKVGYRLEV